MEKWVPVALIALLIVGSGGGYFLASNTLQTRITALEGQLTTAQQQLSQKSDDYTSLNDDYTSLNDDYQALSQQEAALESSRASLQSTYNALKTNYDSLQSTYGSLQTSHSSLQADYNALSSQYDTLQASVDSGLASLSADYVSLQKDYDDLSTMLGNSVYGTPGDTQMLNNLYKLTLAVRSLNSTLWEYCNVVSSFKNTLTTADVLKMEAQVRSIIGSSTDAWANYQRIHQYITSNVKYVYDIEFPYIHGYRYIDVNGVRYLTDFDVSTIENYIQTPEWTLQNKQGDCDDQGALEYAMLRYYNKYIVGTDYNLYLAEFDFSDGSGHIAVFMPVSGGKLTILDPAGNYLTSTYSNIASKAAASELETYNSRWASNGSITKIRLYWINLVDGSYNLVSEGTRAQVASFLSN